MRYNCSLDFGALEIDGIEANSREEAREIAMKSFKPVILAIDETSIRATAGERKRRPIIVTRPNTLEQAKRKESSKEIFERRVKLCRLVAKNAELETGVR